MSNEAQKDQQIKVGLDENNADATLGPLLEDNYWRFVSQH